MIVAGLPSMHRGVTYRARGEWHVLGLLNEEATMRALAGRRRNAGRPMSDAAGRLLADASGRLPWAIQMMGHHAWRSSHESATIELSQAQAAKKAAETELAAGFYESRWQNAAPKERDHLLAMARLVKQGEPTGLPPPLRSAKTPRRSPTYAIACSRRGRSSPTTATCASPYPAWPRGS
jgi:hypothetical protein